MNPLVEQDHSTYAVGLPVDSKQVDRLVDRTSELYGSCVIKNTQEDMAVTK